MKNILKEWKQLSSKVIYKNAFITVMEDEVMKPDGQKGIYGYIKIPWTVCIVAVDKLNNLYLCKQSRYIFREDSWEIPRGFVEKGESSTDAARRELREEAGLSAKSLASVGIIRPSIGILAEETEVFLAKELADQGFNDESHEIEEVKKFTFSEVFRMIRENKIKDGVTISALQKVSHLI